MRKLSAILLFILLLVGCGGAAEPAPTPTEAAIIEPSPTETAVAEPTAVPTESDSDNTAVEEEPDSDETETATTEEVPDSDGTETTTTEEVPDLDETETAATATFQLEAWVDNWFAAYLGEELIVEDSVSITTERSFNSETAVFEGSYPLQLNFILKDFKENDTGLEYIGTRNQQMGDGGFIMQLTDTSSGAVVAVTDSAFACLVIHEAPLDKSCENEANPEAGTAPCEFTETSEPEGWMLADFDDSAWIATTVHSAAAVDPKDGYNNISWDGSAEFIWGPDLETNNTILCRVTVDTP